MARFALKRSPPACGGAGGVVPIEDLKPGDCVYCHEGTAHQILQTFRYRYVGPIVTLVFENEETLRLTNDHLILTERRVQHLSPGGEWSGIPKKNFGRARALRHDMSPPELAVWNRLRGGQLTVKFRKQHPIGPYIADFYCRECGIVVEIDGDQHTETVQAVMYDKKRDAYMEGLGLTVLRFSAYDVGKRLDYVVDEIARHAMQRTLSSDPTKQWRFAASLRAGETVYRGHDIWPVRVHTSHTSEGHEVLFDLLHAGPESYFANRYVICQGGEFSH